jgi:alpha-N-acetylglucosaminidase
MTSATKSILLFCLALTAATGTARADATPNPRQAATALVERLLPGCVDRFTFELLPRDEGRDVFEIESAGPRIVIRGNNGVAMARGLNWYLTYYAQGNVSWCGSQLSLPDPLPAVMPKVRQVSWARYRYFLNYCAFGYSLPWWDWPQWEKLIDWMALNGVNMPLSVTGQEAVWQAVCRRLGMDDRETAEFLAGPPYLPFQWMGCLDGYGGPLPQSWIARHEELEKKILARQRELGVTPVLLGFTGHVPAAVARRFPQARLQHVQWIEWKTQLLDPLDPLFAKIAKMFLEEQTRRFGSDHLYAADTFIEMSPPSGDAKYLADLGRAIYDGMAQNDRNPVWVLQGWAFMNQQAFWTQPRIKAFLDAVPDDRMVVLDLFCESQPMWDRTAAFCGKPWLWCNVQNFGRGVYLGGALERNNRVLQTVRHDPKSGRLEGLGFVNEGLCYNPVAYDLLLETAWRDRPVDLNRWIADYAVHRYGRPNAHAQRAWSLLLESVYRGPGGSSSLHDRAPSLGGRNGGRPSLAYDAARLVEAWRELVQASEELGQSDAFRFDLVNVGRQALANRGTAYEDVALAWKAKDGKLLQQASQRFLQWIADMDDLVATRQEFLLGGWLEDAKRWGDTDAERANLQWNARNQLTLWGAWDSQLRDYACKEWSGMLSGYYAHRWRMFFDRLEAALAAGRPFDAAQCDKDIRRWEAAWTHQTEVYPATPRGDSVEVSRRLWAKYGDRR